MSGIYKIWVWYGINDLYIQGWLRKNATTLIVNFKNIVDGTELLFYLVEHLFPNNGYGTALTIYIYTVAHKKCNNFDS